jgi:uncharacterized protein (TIGR00299 family) protein
MKDLYLDLYCGVSGDMLLGLLVDLGLPADRLARELGLLALPGLDLTARAGRKGALGGTKVDLVCPDQEHERGLADVRAIVEASGLKPAVRERALAVFARLAEAEARVHRVPVADVHFHEVGALDAIGDVVGVVAGLDLLGVGRLFSSPLPLGKGLVETRHGTLPLPAPAVLELARGFPCRQLDVAAELTTPTGAALVTTLASGFGDMPPFTVERVGYGLGARDLAIPNAVRGVLGRRVDAGPDRVVCVEANIDDLNPQVFGYLFDVFFAAGALDVFLTPIQMKKGRPGTKLTVLAEPGAEGGISEIFFAETSTLGVRMATMERRVMPRRTIEVTTRFGVIRAKVAGAGVAPEYEECARAARDHAVPFRDVYEEVKARASAKV